MRHASYTVDRQRDIKCTEEVVETHLPPIVLGTSRIREIRACSDERVYLKFKLRDELNEISTIAKALDRETYPAAKAQSA